MGEQTSDRGGPSQQGGGDGEEQEEQEEQDESTPGTRFSSSPPAITYRTITGCTAGNCDDHLQMSSMPQTRDDSGAAGGDLAPAQELSLAPVHPPRTPSPVTQRNTKRKSRADSTSAVPSNESEDTQAGLAIRNPDEGPHEKRQRVEQVESPGETPPEPPKTTGKKGVKGANGGRRGKAVVKANAAPRTAPRREGLRRLGIPQTPQDVSSA